MKMKSFLLDAGSVIAWKKYPFFTKVWRTMLRKSMPYNKFAIVTSKTELLTSGKIAEEVLIMEPIRKYSKQECAKLQAITSSNLYSDTWEGIVTIINIIRSNTFPGTTGIEDNKYYKKIDWNEKLDEYIY